MLVTSWTLWLSSRHWPSSSQELHPTEEVRIFLTVQKRERLAEYVHSVSCISFSAFKWMLANPLIIQQACSRLVPTWKLGGLFMYCAQTHGKLA